jgi:IS30 family transposase
MPLDHGAMDLAGPLLVTGNGNVYLFVMVDACTKYIIIRVILDKQSTTMVNTLLNITTDYRYIACVDNGGEMKKFLMDIVYKALKIVRRYSTPYYSRGNGAAENAVKLSLNAHLKGV